MPQSRVLVVALLTLAVAGAGWLWWYTSTGNPTSIETSAAETQAVDPDSVDLEAAAEEAISNSEDRSEAERREAANPAGPGRLRVTAVWPDNSPAVGVMVYLRRSVPRLPYTAYDRGKTDSDGVIVFTEVPRGPSSLTSDRSDEKKVTVEGGIQDVTFELAGGISVQGSVKDPQGRRVAGAGIWLQSSNTGWSGGHITAFTDADGEFSLDQLNPEQSLGAVAVGFAPSKLIDLDIVDKSQAPARVELTLLADGGDLHGTVTNTSGKPVAGAFVAVGKRPDRLKFQGERIIEQWTVRTAETDEEGFFRIDGLATGSHPIAIRAKGYGLWRSEVAIEAKNATVISPTLELAATIIGSVSDGEGNPLDQAAIRVYDRKPRTSFLAGGQIDFDEAFGYQAAITGPEGRYRVEGVTAGLVFLFAQRHQESGWGTGESVAYTQAEVQIAPGEESRWDPVIDDGLTIEGRVLFADGFPIPNLFITPSSSVASMTWLDASAIPWRRPSPCTRTIAGSVRASRSRMAPSASKESSPAAFD